MRSGIRNIRRLFSVLLAVCLLAAVLPLDAFAADYVLYQVGDASNGAYLQIDRYTNTIVNSVNIKGDLVIPGEVEGITIRKIGPRAFYKQADVISVTVPGSVTEISDNAFYNCSSLRSFRAAEGLSTMGKSVFAYCYGLSDIYLPSSLKIIDDETFASCIRLQRVTVPSGVTRIGSFAFSNCSSLISVVMPDGVTRIGDNCFNSCHKLEAVILPKGLKEVATSLFDGCESLNSVTLSGNVKSIGQNAFGGCTALKKLILPEGVERLYDWAFKNCKNLSTLSVPDSINSIGADTFYGCDKLKMYVNPGYYAQVFAETNRIPYDASGTLEDKPALPFTDVRFDFWAWNDIEWVYANGYFQGTSGTTFEPETAVDRGMLVTVLYRMEGEPAAGITSFKDVRYSDYFYDAVAWGESCKVITGMGDKKYEPRRSITREQLATMLYRYAKYKGLSTSTTADLGRFRDSNKVGNFARTAMAWAVGNGIINGVDAAHLGPKATATRAQTAAMLRRFSELSY